MAVSDWTALVTSVGGIAAALYGVRATSQAGKRQQETAIMVARMQAEYEARAAERDRRQRLSEEAYRSLMQWIESSGNAVADLRLGRIPSRRARSPQTMPVEPDWPTFENKVLWSEPISDKASDYRLSLGMIWKVLHDAEELAGWNRCADSANMDEDLYKAVRSVDRDFDRVIEYSLDLYHEVRKLIRDELFPPFDSSIEASTSPSEQPNIGGR